MAINIAGLNEKRSFHVEFDDEVSVKMKHINKGDLRKILKKSTSTKFSAHQKAEEFDATKADVLLGQEVIEEWYGVKINDQDAPCTPENIALLMTHHNKFCDFINTMCGDIDALVEAEKEYVLKNS